MMDSHAAHQQREHTLYLREVSVVRVQRPDCITVYLLITVPILLHLADKLLLVR